MIDRFRRLARAIQILRLPALGITFVSLTSLCVLIFFAEPRLGSQFFIPGLLGLLWGLTSYIFIVLFREVPDKTRTPAAGLWKRVTRRLIRGLYWLTGVVFLVITAAVVIVTLRLVFIWVSDYFG